MSVINTIFSNITLLLSHSVICFGYFMPRGHGVIKNAPTIVSPPPFSITGFSPGLLVVLQEILYQPFFLLWSTRLLQKTMSFQSKTYFFFQLIAGRFWFCCFVSMCFSGRFFTVLVCIYIHSFLFGLSSNAVA